MQAEAQAILQGGNVLRQQHDVCNYGGRFLEKSSTWVLESLCDSKVALALVCGLVCSPRPGVSHHGAARKGAVLFAMLFGGSTGELLAIIVNTQVRMRARLFWDPASSSSGPPFWQASIFLATTCACPPLCAVDSFAN